MRRRLLAPTLGGTERSHRMSLKHFSLLLAAAFATVVAAGAASASTAGNPSLLIRHQVHGCHAWSINGGPFKASQSLALKRGSRLTFTNDGVYRLTTKPGEDYMKGMKTIGEDNVLRLTVTVT